MGLISECKQIDSGSTQIQDGVKKCKVYQMDEIMLFHELIIEGLRES